VNLSRRQRSTGHRIGPCQRCGLTLPLAKSTSVWTLILGSGPERRWMCRGCVADCVAEIDWLEDAAPLAVPGGRTSYHHGERNVA
jgi:hypothetical protein